MRDYTAPLRDMEFVLRELAPARGGGPPAGLRGGDARARRGRPEGGGEARLGVLSPLNPSGDREGARWRDGEVSTAAGWREAYRQFVEGGWSALSVRSGVRRAGAAAAGLGAGRGDVERRQRLVQAVPHAHAGAIEAIELRGSQAHKPPTCRSWSAASGPAP